MNVPARPGRQIFIFTSGEKKAVSFVVAALVLGLVTKHYRDGHPQPLPPSPSKLHTPAKPPRPSARSRILHHESALVSKQSEPAQ